jgi:hypothetical protein
MAQNAELEDAPSPAPRPPTRVERFLKLVAFQLILATVALTWISFPLWLVVPLMPAAVWVAWRRDQATRGKKPRQPLIVDDE